MDGCHGRWVGGWGYGWWVNGWMVVMVGDGEWMVVMWVDRGWGVVMMSVWLVLIL